MKKWLLRQNKVDTEKMAQSLGVSPILAEVLANRGIGTYGNAVKFLTCDEKAMYDGYLFKDMETAMDILNKAIDEKKKISVYGDYDVDGVMSTVILYKTLKYLGANVMYYVPHRQKEGYGINISSVEELCGMEVNLILACDNGIAAIAEAEAIAKAGMEFIILDHHEPPIEVLADGQEKEILPKAVAIVDHKQKACGYPFKALCAGAMAYKFSKLLFERRKEKFVYKDEFIVFAAMATVCDIVDLLDENRIIAKNGLRLIKDSANIGLQALMEQTGINKDSITEYHVGFILGPCVNATGRLESAKESVELFTTEDVNMAKEMALHLAQLNDERKLLTSSAAKRAMDAIENSSLMGDKVIVVYDDKIHESIAGIVAGRIKEKYYKPAIVLTKGDEMAKGSARSIEGYNMFVELSKQKHLMHKFGGHPMAAGLSLKEENIGVLRAALNQACTLTEEEMMPSVHLEKAISFSQINMDIANELLTLAPFGKANPSPLFGTKNVFAEKIRLVGQNKNIMQLNLRDIKTGISFKGISFNALEEFTNQSEITYGLEKTKKILSGLEGVKMDVLYSITINTYLGKSSVQLNINDFRL